MTKQSTKALTKAEGKFLDAAVAIQLDPATPEDAAFMARQLVQATLPHSNPKSDVWKRTNGNLTLGIQAGYDMEREKSYGLPYGTIPRLLLFWMTTEAVKTKTPRLELGKNLADFMREVGLNPNTGGGKRSDAKRLQEQMQKLFRARISFQQTTQGERGRGEAWLDMQIAPEGELWWNPKTPEQSILWDSWIELGDKFYKAITAAPIPVDIRALKALKRSPLALDLYALCCYEAYRVERTGKPRFIPWRSLMKQLGADYEGEHAARDFGVKCRRALRKISTVMTLNLDDAEGGLTILPGSLPAIPSKPKNP